MFVLFALGKSSLLSALYDQSTDLLFRNYLQIIVRLNASVHATFLPIKSALNMIKFSGHPAAFSIQIRHEK
jgi:hypothetical protein